MERWTSGSRLAVLDATHQLAGLLLALVLQVGQQEGDDPAAPVADRLIRAERIARNHLAGRFTAADMAAAGMSRGHFSTVYREHRGITPAEFLR